MSAPPNPEASGRRRNRSLATGLLLGALLIPAGLDAQQQSGCFSGRDHLGYPARVFVTVERYGDYFEIYGQVQSMGTGQVYRFKADGHSGAGRVFSRHEYEAGASYIRILELNQSTFVLQVEGYGVFRYQRSRC